MTRKHTTLNLDEALVQEAREILGTTQVTETVHEALREVIRQRARRRLMEYDTPYLTPEAIREWREDRELPWREGEA